MIEKRRKRNILAIELTREMHLEFKVLAHNHNMSMKALIILLLGEFARKMKAIEGEKE